MRDHRMGLSLITDVLDVLNRHGYARGDDEHAGRAIFLISDLAHIYEGSQDHPFGPSINEIPPQTEPAPPASQEAALAPAGKVKDPPGRPGHRRRLPARPRRDVRRVRRPDLPGLRVAPAGRPGI